MLDLQVLIDAIDNSLEQLRKEHSKLEQAESFAYQVESNLYTIERCISNNGIADDVDIWDGRNFYDQIKECKEHVSGNILSLENTKTLLEEKLEENTSC